MTFISLRPAAFVRVLVALCVPSTLVACGESASQDDTDTDAADTTGTGTTGAMLPEGCDQYIEPSDDDQTVMAEAFAEAVDGSTICLAAGTFVLTRQQTLGASGVTLRGMGADMTILDFAGQISGGNGLLVSGNDVTLTDFGVRDTPGDGIRADQVSNITFERIHVEWTALHSLENGAYGLYPVQATGVVIRECVVNGARDAGIYVGQSTNIIVEDSIAHDNVAGIEIENSTDSIVRRNEAYNNTAGILVFNLPGLDVKDGKRCNVYENDVHDNNVDNFADPGTVVGIVPPGVGMLVLAADSTEIHDNTIGGNRSVGVAIITYSSESMLFEEPNDPEYDIWSEGNYVHDNTYVDNGTDPHELVLLLTASAMPGPDVIFDGCFGADKDNADGALSNCVGESPETRFMDADLCGQGMGISTDATLVACTQPSLPTE
jgi:parallel beta-helix repeat protein